MQLQGFRGRIPFGSRLRLRGSRASGGDDDSSLAFKELTFNVLVFKELAFRELTFKELAFNELTFNVLVDEFVDCVEGVASGSVASLETCGLVVFCGRSFVIVVGFVDVCEDSCWTYCAGSITI